MREMKWTNEQRKAIETKDCNLLVAAAAGSGKTAVLVQRIIEKIMDKENPVDIDRLLIVTFTKAAASEMKERIGAAISEELDKNPDSKILQRQLTLLNRANITTIHSFCLKVIKNNFHLIDIDPTFRVADETESILLKQEALEEVFENIYYEENCTKEFKELLDSFGGKSDRKLLEVVESLYNFSQSLSWPFKWLNEKIESFNIGKNYDFSKSIWATTLKENIKIELNGVKNQLKSSLNILGEYNEELIDYIEVVENELKYVKELLGGEETDIIKGLLYFDLGRLPGKRLKGEVKDTKDRAIKLRDKAKESINKLKEDINLGYENVEKNMKELYPRMKCLIDLVMKFTMEYDKRKREKNIIDFNDIEHFALGILTDFDEEEKVMPSSVALEYRNKFEEVLVDEYQDSNFVQEAILNSISRQDNLQKTIEDEKLIIPNLFMVGDIKQSIYRFRQAKPELFLEKYDNYSEEEGNKYRKIKLFKNFRSRKNIIEGVNFIFKQIMSKNVGELEYGEGEKLNYGADFKEVEEDKEVERSIEIHLMDKEENIEVYSEELGLDEEENIDNIQLEARMVGKIINNLIKDENDNSFMVQDKATKEYRKVQYRDIVILMRATSAMANIFTEELNNVGIPVFADTSSGYFETIEIKTIMSLLQIVDNPRQDIPMLSVLRCPIFSFSPEDIIDIRLINRDISIYECLEKIANTELCLEEEKLYIDEINNDLKERIISFLQKLNLWRDNSIHMSIDQFIWYLYTETGYYGYVGAMPGGIQRQANLRLLFERAKQYENTSYKGFFNFISFINKLKNTSGDMGSAKILGENENVVRIMSIHKSKGLEFPVVIMAGAGRGFNFQDIRKDILFHHELGFGPEYVDLNKKIKYPTIMKKIISQKIKLETLSEEMRILYVAFTRAKEKLIISGAVKDIEKSMREWCSIGQQSEQRIPEYEIIKSKNYLDWIMPALARHKDFQKYIEKELPEIEMENGIEDDSSWSLRFWNKKQLLENKLEDPKERDIIKEIELNKEKNYDDLYKDEVNRRLNWKYKYIKASEIPAKLSVSEIKSRFEILDTENSEALIEENIFLRKPQFLEKFKKFSSAEIGTFTHLVMQHIDFQRTNSIKDIEDQIKELIKKEFLTKEQAKVINIKKIFKFIQNPIVDRIKKSHNVKREQPFYIEMSSKELMPNISDVYKDEKILIQGVIDLYFQDGEDLIILDYKTDYIEDIEKTKDKYYLQIEYYKKALEKITGKKVKEKYLYLFNIDRLEII
ncbi:helicase-exonuclease AddAB subunit AddA [Clostridium cochlearium]|nr:helicase-exonuclease AddAB subunit AddA [Clostridium cochlearium]